jgi:hypothetical protein
MIRFFRSCLSLVAAATVLLSVTGPDLRAQTTVRERWDQVTLGNNDVGIDAIAWARARNNLGTERRVDTMLLTQARLFGLSVELQRIAATAIRNGTSFAGSTSLRRAGLTVRNDAVTNTGTISYWNSANVFGSNPHQTFWIYFIPITVGANLGHIGSMDVTLLNMSNYGAMISGAMSTFAWGFASFAVGVSGAQCGMQVDIRVGEQRMDGVLGSFTNYLSTAYLNYYMTPLRLWLRVFCELSFLSGSVTVVDASFGARSLVPFLR